MRQYIGMAVAGTLLLAAGFGLYWVLGMGRGDGTVPVLTADASPVKVAPDPTTTGSNLTRPSPPSSTSSTASTTPPPARRWSRPTSRPRPTSLPSAATRSSKSGLANRKVRTVTVRPDGTIVSGDDAVAGSEALPVDRPNVPEVPGDAAAATDVLANAAEGVAQDPIAAVIANPDAAPRPPTSRSPTVRLTAVPGQPRSEHPHPDAADAEPRDRADGGRRRAARGRPTRSRPSPAEHRDDHQRPAPRPALARQRCRHAAAPAPTQVAEAAPVQSTPGNPAPAYVQLSAQRDEATAMADARRFTERFASVIGNTALEVHIVDLGAKGTWYRVLLPANSSSAANTACANIKNAGGDCLIR